MRARRSIGWRSSRPYQTASTVMNARPVDQDHQQRVGGQPERQDLVELVHISNLIILAITPRPTSRLVRPMPIITQPRGSVNRVLM